jgi:hypothetical protein
MRQRRRKVKNRYLFLIGILISVSVIGLTGGCATEPPPEGALSVSELLENPLYDTEVTIYGRVSLLGEIRCPCFELTSGGETVQVWYAWYEDGWPAVSVERMQNGDQVIVTGELKTVGADRHNEFAARAIEE